MTVPVVLSVRPKLALALLLRRSIVIQLQVQHGQVAVKHNKWIDGKDRAQFLFKYLDKRG